MQAHKIRREAGRLARPDFGRVSYRRETDLERGALAFVAGRSIALRSDDEVDMLLVRLVLDVLRKDNPTLDRDFMIVLVGNDSDFYVSLGPELVDRIIGQRRRARAKPDYQMVDCEQLRQTLLFGTILPTRFRRAVAAVCVDSDPFRGGLPRVGWGTVDGSRVGIRLEMAPLYSLGPDPLHDDTGSSGSSSPTKSMGLQLRKASEQTRLVPATLYSLGADPLHTATGSIGVAARRPSPWCASRPAIDRTALTSDLSLSASAAPIALHWTLFCLCEPQVGSIPPSGVERPL